MIMPESRGASVGVVLAPDSITMNLHLELKENLTLLPTLNIYIDESNSTQLIKPIEAAMQRLVPSAQVSSSNFRLHARTVLLNATLKMWLLQENYTLVVLGATKNSGGNVRSSLSFLSMNVSDSIRSANVELNTVGVQYLLQPLKGQPVSQTSYFLNGATFLNPVIPGNATLRFNLLDFTWVPPIYQWNHRDDPFVASSRWSYDPASISPPKIPYNLTLGVYPTPENTFRQVYTALFNPSLQLEAPARAWTEGNLVSFDLTTPADKIMPIIILASLGTGVASFVLEWKITRRGIQRKRK